MARPDDSSVEYPEERAEAVVAPPKRHWSRNPMLIAVVTVIAAPLTTQVLSWVNDLGAWIWPHVKAFLAAHLRK